jgi:hypothetical protein
MNSRVATWINVLVALFTITAVGIDIRVHHLNAVRVIAAEQAQRRQAEHSYLGDNATSDIASVRVDDLASVPPAEIHDVLSHATPAEVTALALKFNDLPADGPTIGAVGMFFQAWAERDGMSAISGAFQIKNVDLRRVAALWTVGSVSPSISADVVRYLKEHPDKDLEKESKGAYLDLLLEKWAYVDAPAAAKYLDDLGAEKKSLSNLTAGSVSYGWATVDPLGALAWVDEEIKKDPSAESAFKPAIVGWCAKDIDAAASYVCQHLDHPGSIDAIVSVAQVMFQKDQEKALTWMDDLPSGDSKSSAESNFAYSWAQKDPVAAADWARTLPEDEQMGVISSVMRTWAGQNWTEARKWINDQNGDLRDYAIVSALNSGTDSISTSEGLSLAVSMTNRQMRLDAIQNFIVQWAHSEPQAAAAWVKSSPLSRQDKQQLLSNEVFSTDSTSQDN